MHGVSRYDAETVGCHAQEQRLGKPDKRRQRFSVCSDVDAKSRGCGQRGGGRRVVKLCQRAVPHKGGGAEPGRSRHRTLRQFRVADAAKSSGGPLPRYLVLPSTNLWPLQGITLLEDMHPLGHLGFITSQPTYLPICLPTFRPTYRRAAMGTFMVEADGSLAGPPLADRRSDAPSAESGKVWAGRRPSLVAGRAGSKWRCV